MAHAFLARTDVRDFIDSLHGQFFTVEFTKRSTGELRRMNASRNYRSLLVGGHAKYDATAKNLVVVRDEGKNAIRSIPLDSVIVIRARKNVYHIVG